MLGRVLLLASTFLILHAAFSTYEHLSYLKAMERPEGPIPSAILIETFISLVLGIVGASLNAPALEEITWASEMRKRTIDEMDSRLGFANYLTRGRNVFTKRNVAPAPKVAHDH